MSKGISLHLGLNQIDPAHYGTPGNLRGCENDARGMRAIATAYGYESKILLTQQATSDNVLEEVSSAAERLDSGDIFMLTYAGHGSQVRDLDDEEDRLDETWCLYNRMLIDDELYRLWAQFRRGVRIIMVSDSCHNGTMLRMYNAQRAAIKPLMATSRGLTDERDLETPVYRVLPPDYAIHAFAQFRDLYRRIKLSGPRTGSQVATSVLLLAACQDNQTAADGGANGLFTAALLAVWSKGTFAGDYKTFYKRIASVMPPTQSPNYVTTGLANPTFEQESPFTISGKPPESGKPPTKTPPVKAPACSASKASGNQETSSSKGVIQMPFTRTDIPPSSDAKVTVEFGGLIPLSPGDDNTCVFGVHRWTYSHTFQGTLVVRKPNSPPTLVRLFTGPPSGPFLIRYDPDPPGPGVFQAFAPTDEPFRRDDPENDERDYRWSINLRGEIHQGAETNDGAQPGGKLKAGVLYTSTLTRADLLAELRRGSEVIALHRFAARLAAAIELPDGFKVRIEWYEMGQLRSLTLPRQNDPEDTTYVISLMNDPPISYPEDHDELEHYYEILHVDGLPIPPGDRWELAPGDRTTDEIPCMPTILE